MVLIDSSASNPSKLAGRGGRSPNFAIIVNSDWFTLKGDIAPKEESDAAGGDHDGTHDGEAQSVVEEEEEEAGE
jgi:hypothetical protein